MLFSSFEVTYVVDFFVEEILEVSSVFFDKRGGVIRRHSDDYVVVSLHSSHEKIMISDEDVLVHALFGL